VIYLIVRYAVYDQGIAAATTDLAEAKDLLAQAKAAEGDEHHSFEIRAVYPGMLMVPEGWTPPSRAGYGASPMYGYEVVV